MSVQTVNGAAPGDRRTRAVAVVDDRDRLIGIVTATGLLGLLAGPPRRRAPLMGAAHLG